MKKIMTVHLEEKEVNILSYLLREHIQDGSYFGRQVHHYKMCQKLLLKFDQDID